MAMTQASVKTASSLAAEFEFLSPAINTPAAMSGGKSTRLLTPKGSVQQLSRQERPHSPMVPSRRSSNGDLRSNQNLNTSQLAFNFKSSKTDLNVADNGQQQSTLIQSKVKPSVTGLPAYTEHKTSKHPFFSLPLELQSAILPHLPYRSLLALRLTSRHFSSTLLTLPVLSKLRKSIIEESVLCERKTLGHILKVPGVRSRWNRFWYQDPFYLSYLLWKLEQSDDKLSLASFKAMEHLRCYTCLEMKGAFNGDYVRKFSTRSRGLGGTRAQTRMCKDCMMRKCISGLHGRWWKEGYWRDSDIVRVRKTHLPQKLKRFVSSKKHNAQATAAVEDQKEHGVCSKCRGERFALYWGCAACFEGEEKIRQTLDKIGLSQRQQRAYDLRVHLAELNNTWERYSGLRATRHAHWSFYNIRHAFDWHKLKSLRNLVGGRDFWMYLEWKARQRRYERTQRENAAASTIVQQMQQQDHGLAGTAVATTATTTGADSAETNVETQTQHQQQLTEEAQILAAELPVFSERLIILPNEVICTSLSVASADSTASSSPSSSTPSFLAWSPYPAYDRRCSNYEIRCSDCWKYNRPTEWFVSAVYESLRFEHMCGTCRAEVVDAKARAQMRRDCCEALEERDGAFVLAGLANLFDTD